MVLQAVYELYPGFDVSISFLPEEEFAKYVKDSTAYGVTLFEVNLPPLILVNAMTPAMHCVEIIAHEVAHVVAGLRAGHGKKWWKEFENIYEKYCELHSKVCEELNKEAEKMAKDKNIKETKKAPENKGEKDRISGEEAEIKYAGTRACNRQENRRISSCKITQEGVLKKKYQKAILQTLLKKFEEAEQR